MTTETERRERQVHFVRERYPRSGALRNGHEFQVGLMDRGDRDAILTFATALPHDDLLYLRNDITDPHGVDSWIAEIDRGRTVTVLARDGDQILGEASLLYGAADWTRHRGDIRLIVSSQARGQGLGHFLAEEIFVIAEILGLQKLSAQMSHDQQGAQSVFRGLGFESVAVLPGFVVDRDGNQLDLVVMAYDVTARGVPTSARERGRSASGS